MRILRLPTLLALLLPCVATAQSVITNTVYVPLHYRTIQSGGSKLGIFASLGGGTAKFSNSTPAVPVSTPRTPRPIPANHLGGA